MFFLEKKTHLELLFVMFNSCGNISPISSKIVLHLLEIVVGKISHVVIHLDVP